MHNIGIPLSNGDWVTESTARAVELVHEVYPDLEVYWIPRDKREESEAAFAICYRDTGDVAFFVKTEEDMNPSIIDRIFEADNTKNLQRNSKLLDQSNKPKQLVLPDDIANKYDFYKHMLKGRRNYYREGGMTYSNR